MKIAEVIETFAVSQQLQPDEIQDLAQLGFGTVICNRPDGEEPGQPTAAAMREAADAARLAFHHIPVSGGEFPDSAVRAFADVHKAARGKVIAYCRTGTRSITLDALANVDNTSADVRIGRAERDKFTLQHVRYPNVFGLGDAGSTPNAKTMAAARKQAPIVAINALSVLDGRKPLADYDGYGSCPLTVERGKIVLAEFGYDGKLLPSFPKWVIDGTRPRRLSWLLKSEALPWIYWNGMLKGHEWLASPHERKAA